MWGVEAGSICTSIVKTRNPFLDHFPPYWLQVWFAWTVLNMESIFEEDSQLRRVVERELVTNSLTPDQALKVQKKKGKENNDWLCDDASLWRRHNRPSFCLQKAQAQLKLPIVPSLQRLLIYRWAHQALATPADHPLLPLIWQKFFLLYLHRPGPQYGWVNVWNLLFHYTCYFSKSSW